MKEADFAHLVMIFNQILRFLIPALLLPCLDRVEALSIDSGCRADREEGVRIYKLDMAQDHIEVSLSGNHHKNMAGLLGIPSGSGKYSDSPVEFSGDTVCNLVILLGKYEQLHGLTGTRDVEIHDIAVDSYQYETIHYGRDLVRPAYQGTVRRI